MRDVEPQFCFHIRHALHYSSAGSTFRMLMFGRLFLRIIMVLGIAQYNVCSLIRTWRISSIATAMTPTDGTRIRMVGNQASYVQTVDVNHWIVHFPWSRGPFTNRSAGCAILFDAKLCKPRNIVQVWTGPQGALGRAGAVRIMTARSDYTPITMYFPPKPALAAHMALWEKTVKLLCQWLDDLLCLLPVRTFPVIGLDLNDGWIDNTPGHAALGEFLVGRGGFASLSFACVLEKHHMIVATSFFPHAPTYHGFTQGAVSYVDHIVVPRCARNEIFSLHTWERTGRALQPIPDVRPRDHMPVVIKLNYTLAAILPQRGHNWDSDRIASTMHHDVRTRSEFIARVELGISEWRALSNSDGELTPGTPLPFDVFEVCVTNARRGGGPVRDRASAKSISTQVVTHNDAAPPRAVEPSSRPVGACEGQAHTETAPSSAVEHSSRPVEGCDDHNVLHEHIAPLSSYTPTPPLPHSCAHAHLRDCPSGFSKQQLKLLKFHYRKQGWAWDGGIRHTRSTGSTAAHMGTIAISHRHAPAIVKRRIKRR